MNPSFTSPASYGGNPFQSTPSSGSLNLGAATYAIIGIALAIAFYFASKWFYGRNTVPEPSYKVGFENKKTDGFVGGCSTSKNITEGFLGGCASSNRSGPQALTEGFGGVAKGAGIPDCSRSSAEGAELIAMFGTPSSTEDGNDDLRELIKLVGKLSCFKKDLVSPSHIVEATRRQNYATSHDIEPIGETTGRCFAKTISPRDLELAFDKWTARGLALVERNCTSFRLTGEQYDKAKTLFNTMIRDVKDIARGACLQGEPSIAGKPGPRDPHPFEDPAFIELGEYKGYY